VRGGALVVKDLLNVGLPVGDRKVEDRGNERRQEEAARGPVEG